MGKEFVKSVCMVCMLCTIHTHCTVHHNLSNLDKIDIPTDLGDRNQSRPAWSQPVEPAESALNPQLDLKQFKNTQSVKHKHSDGVNDNAEFTRRHHWGPKAKVGTKSVDSSYRSERLGIERLRSDDNERASELNALNSNVDSLGEDLTPMNHQEGGFSSEFDSKNQRLRISRETKVVADLEKQLHLRRVFEKFGNGSAMTYEGFERLLKSLGLERLVSDEGEREGSTPRKSQKLNTTNMQSLHNTNSIDNNATQVNQVCLKSRDIFTEFVNSFHDHSKVPPPHNESAAEPSELSEEALYRLCPSLLYQMTSATAREKEEGCFFVSEHTGGQNEEIDMGKVWLYSTLSILGISLCGLLGVAVIPIMQHVFYQQLLQFLVALAIGTLCGDALLHLLPHAMAPVAHEGSSHGGHEHGGHGHSQHDESAHDTNMWRGFVAALGLVFFFVTEKCLLLGGEWLKQRQRMKKVPGRVRVMRDADNTGSSTVGEKLCKHKYSSYPYCYGEITTEITDDHHHKTPQYNKTEHNHNTPSPPIVDKTAVSDNGNHVVAEDDHEPRANFLTNTDAGKVAATDKGEAHELNPSEAESYTVIIREHENAHHGHSHSHGHVHSAPSNLSSVAWMVIMGDGLHNLTDGMAIGAAFAASLAGGFSTAIAVFCHELPHELGDFAVLLKAGMSLKEAIFYNVMSSILCLIGMIGGVIMGRDESVTHWVFALAAGMFLYIALVDMIPELTSSHSKEGGSFCQFLLQTLGLVAGLGIMLVIATYEHDLKTIFTD